jgi:hypothetical protein
MPTIAYVIVDGLALSHNDIDRLLDEAEEAVLANSCPLVMDTESRETIMETEALFREVVKAAALGDMDRAAQLDDQIPEQDSERFTTFLTAMFCGALEHRFGGDPSPDAVRRFVQEACDDFRDAQPPIKPLVLEGVIRGMLGEEHLLDEISAEDQLLYQIPVIRKIVHQSAEMKARIDDYLTDAETLAAKWDIPQP